MSDYLTRLVERSLGVGEVVSPRLQSLFEPRDAVAGPALVDEPIEVREERLAPASEHAPRSDGEPAAPSPSAKESTTASPRRRTEPPHDVVVERESPAEPGSPPPAVEFAVSEREVLARAESPVPTLRPQDDQSGERPSPEPPRRRTVVVRERQHPPQSEPAARERRRDRVPTGPDEVRLPSPPALQPPPVPAQAAPTEPPVVRVTIGRVEVRAVLPPAPPERATPRRAPRMTLDEYLRQGDGR